MFKKVSCALLSLIFVLSFSACGKIENGSQTAENAKIKVSVTFDAMKEFVEAVGGDKVEISTIIPDGSEPHDFEPKAMDLVGLSTARIFVYNGLGMEIWAQDAIGATNNKNLIAVDASNGTTPITNTDPDMIKEHGQYDPHIWLSLKGAELESKNIRDALVKADPADQAYYNNNYSGFVSQLEALYSEYYSKFQSVKNKSFVTGHAAFAYLSRDFGLVQNSVEDVFAEGEPSAENLAKLINYCKANNVKTVFVEDMVSPDVSQTLADAVGAKVEKIYTIESSEGNMSYLDRMKANLQEIYDSLAQ